jgi:hypothetical protein
MGACCAWPRGTELSSTGVQAECPLSTRVDPESAARLVAVNPLRRGPSIGKEKATHMRLSWSSHALWRVWARMPSAWQDRGARDEGIPPGPRSRQVQPLPPRAGRQLARDVRCSRAVLVVHMDASHAETQAGQRVCHARSRGPAPAARGRGESVSGLGSRARGAVRVLGGADIAAAWATERLGRAWFLLGCGQRRALRSVARGAVRTACCCRATR